LIDTPEGTALPSNLVILHVIVPESAFACVTVIAVYAADDTLTIRVAGVTALTVGSRGAYTLKLTGEEVRPVLTFVAVTVNAVFGYMTPTDAVCAGTVYVSRDGDVVATVVVPPGSVEGVVVVHVMAPVYAVLTVCAT
jgi:hypothetical protein